jgi:hypothetical protein
VGRPKSVVGGAAGGSEGDTADHSDDGGRGTFSPLTGLHEYYEEEPDAGKAVTWEEILGRWSYLVADFAAVYGIRLLTRPAMSWAEFRLLTEGVLADPASRLSRAFAPPPPDPEPAAPDTDSMTY